MKTTSVMGTETVMGARCGGIWRRVTYSTIAVSLLAVPSFVVGTGVAVAADSQHFQGPFTATEYHPPACASLVGICTHGMLFDKRGELIATYNFTMDSTSPTGSGITLSFTGHSVITKVVAPFGVMFSHDDGDFTPEPLGQSPLTTNAHVYDGTGAYAGATGLFVATGALNIVSGTVTGTYTGDVMVQG